MPVNIHRIFVYSLALTALLLVSLSASAKDPERPNILVIWGDDVGMWNISAYHRGMMGGTTPNIDRIAEDGMIFMRKLPVPPGAPPLSPANILFVPASAQ
jgi:arylsulfatase